MEWYTDAWDDLCDILGTPDPTEVVPRVRTLKEQLDRIDAEAERAAPDGLVTISEVEEVFQDMHAKLSRLREQNAALVEQLEAEADGNAGETIHALHDDVNALLDTLSVSTVDEAHERIESLQQQLDTLYEDKECLVEAGLTSAEEALDEIDRLQGITDTLTEERDTLRRTLEEETAERERLSDEVDRLKTANRRLNGEVDTLENKLEEARDERDRLHDRFHDAEAHREELKDERDTLRDERDTLQNEKEAIEARYSDLEQTHDAVCSERDDLRSECESLQQSMARLKETAESVQDERDRLREKQASGDSQQALQAMESILGLHTPEEARALARSVRQMKKRLDALSAAQDRLASETGVDDPDHLLAMIENMEQQLIDLYKDRETGDGPIPDAIVRTLGISSVEEADKLAETVRRMDDRLRTLSDQHERLAEATGLESTDDALTMIQSLEEQLVDLYQEREQTAAGQEQSAAGGEAPAAKGAAVSEEVVNILGVSTADEAREMAQTVRRMGERLHALRDEYSKVTSDLGVDSADDARAMIQNMEAQLVDLYQSIETREAQSTSDSTSDEASSEIAEVLGIQTVEEARDFEALVRQITNQLEELTAKQEKLQKYGLSSVDGALAMIDTMEEQLVDLYNEQEEGSQEELLADLPSASTGEWAREEKAAYDTMVNLLGVESEEEVAELSQMVQQMSSQLDRLTEEHAKLMDTGMNIDEALSMIDSMEEQLVDLYGERETGGEVAASMASHDEIVDGIRTVSDTLGVDVPDDVEPAAMLTALADRARSTLNDGNEILAEIDVAEAHTWRTLMQRLEEQLVDLYHERSTLEEAETRLDAIRDVLGIETREQAEELASLAMNMEDQLQTLLAEKERLEDVGLTSISDAVRMIENMDAQLNDLYEDVENLQRRSSGPSTDSYQDTFEQLETLYAEQEKLERELGVSSAEELVEMVEGLATQLDEFYASSEGTPYDAASSELPSSDADAPASRRLDGNETLMVLSMQKQLEALYQEKEVLFDNGMGQVDEALSRIRTLEKRTDQLDRENTSYEKRLQQLKKQVGTADPAQIAKMIDSLKSRVLQQSDRQAANQPDASGDTSEAAPKPGLFISAAPQFADDDTLERLESMSSEALNDLPYGVIRLSNEGNVEFVNEAGLDLPGMKEVDDRTTLMGKNFFLDLAPSTKNNLFFGRFMEGLRQGAMDARFPYTFISPGRPPKVLTVHLHRKPERDVNWLLFRPM